VSRGLASRCAVVVAVAGAAAVAQDAVVVPAAYALVEAPNAELWAFAPFPARRQLIVDARHLTPLAGRSLAGLAVRRNQGAADANAGGRIHLQLLLAAATVDAASAGEEFAHNRGATVRVHHGPLDLPDCGAAPVTPAPWAAPYAVELPFAVPYPYASGHLCVETVTTVPVATLPWWPVDAVIEPLGGTVTPVGASCLPAVPGTPAGADPATLALGARATFWLRGSQRDGPVVCLLGTSSRSWGGLQLPLDLTALGLPGCSLRNDVQQAAPGWLASLPQAPFTLATWEARVPDDTAFAGATLFAQWLVLAQPPTSLVGVSNGVQATLGTARATLGVFWLEAADPGAARGRALPGRAPVLRLHASP
jgi:hypothetical protein